jgi:hypothetical protein
MSQSARPCACPKRAFTIAGTPDFRPNDDTPTPRRGTAGGTPAGSCGIGGIPRPASFHIYSWHLPKPDLPSPHRSGRSGVHAPDSGVVHFHRTTTGECCRHSFRHTGSSADPEALPGRSDQAERPRATLLISAASSTAADAPWRTISSIARPTTSVLSSVPGINRRSSGSSGRLNA